MERESEWCVRGKRSVYHGAAFHPDLAVDWNPSPNVGHMYCQRDGFVFRSRIRIGDNTEPRLVTDLNHRWGPAQQRGNSRTFRVEYVAACRRSRDERRWADVGWSLVEACKIQIGIGRSGCNRYMRGLPSKLEVAKIHSGDLTGSVVRLPFVECQVRIRLVG